MSDARISPTHGALYGDLHPAAKRRRCDGHLSDPHWIEVGDLFIWSALPPNNNDIGNTGWWHAAYCHDCAPERTPA